MGVEQILAEANEKNVVAQWDEVHRYTPAPRHRRRLLMGIVKKLDFSDCLDAGCAQPYLLEKIVRRFGVAGFGCDISDQTMALNRQRLPDCQFMDRDLTREVWPDGRLFDLVICSEVLEHIPNWRAALANLARMSRKHLLITVPGGKRRLMDQLVGHHQHFEGPELIGALKESAFEVVKFRRWGFPFHSLYKWLISKLSPDKLYQSFSGTRVSWSQRMLSHVLYLLFFLNDPFRQGDQLIVLARRVESKAESGER
jgi:hypothetical protein